MSDLLDLADVLRNAARDVLAVADELDGNDDVLDIIDRIDKMPVNINPHHALFLANFGPLAFWPVRGEATTVRGRRVEVPEAVTGLTIHHTMSHSPLATARHCTATKGYPTGQYHYWISQGDGCLVYQLAEEYWAMWHDNTGPIQTTLSIGMAGSLHLKRPPDEQLDAVAALVRFLMDKHGLTVDDVQGHKDRWSGTVCPGWDSDRSGRWRDDFYERLR
jgi:hypothetical protein